MVKQLTPPERELIEELDKKGFKAPEIAREVARRLESKIRDTRTIKQYIANLPKKQSSDLETQLEWLKHKQEIHSLIGKLKTNLKFVSPVQLWIPDTPDAKNPETRVGVSIYGDVVEWDTVNGTYFVKLDPGFDIVTQHLRSSKRRVALDELEKWSSMAGKCIKECKHLRIYIEKEVGERTRLVGIPSDNVERGLLDGFSRSVYWATFHRVAKSQAGYRISGESDNLRLLSYDSYHLGWFRNDEVERIKDIHHRLINICRKLAIKVEILRIVKELTKLRVALRKRLDRFCSYAVIPGYCDKCP